MDRTASGSMPAGRRASPGPRPPRRRRPTREIARQALQLKLVALRQKEVLARAAFDRSGLSFAPLPAIPEPG